MSRHDNDWKMFNYIYSVEEREVDGMNNSGKAATERLTLVRFTGQGVDCEQLLIASRELKRAKIG